jgi:hypothetical protein
MNLIQEMAAQAREDSKLLSSMCGVYPGDPSGEMTRDAIALEMVAQILEVMEPQIMEKATALIPKVEITVS